MEEGLLLPCKQARDDDDEAGRRRDRAAWVSEVRTEVKRVGWLAAPMVAVTMSQFLLQVISTMMVGHLSEVALSSAAIATSLAGVTGFSLLLGMSSGLETLCGQAYGAQQYQKLGIYTYRAILSLLLVCFPISLLWLSMGKLLCLIGQDPDISREAGIYAVWLIPGLFAYATAQPLTKFLLSQSLIFPMLISSFTVLCIHVPLCWVLVFTLGWGNVGAALSISISYWLNVLILALYIKYSTSCDSTRSPLSMEAFRGINEFFGLAVPSAVMICLEWWSFELLILLSGLLPNPKLETSVLSICLTSIGFLYTIPYGLGAAASTRVSNELGAGSPQGARLVVCVVMFLAVVETSITSSTLFVFRHIWGYAFSNLKEVADYATEMAPLLCVSIVTNSLQGVISGVARGCGWQHIGAYVNLGAYYLAGIPIAVVSGFVLRYGGKGLWIGIVTGTALQSTLLCLITIFTNWQRQANMARERVFEETRLKRGDDNRLPVTPAHAI